MEPFLVGFGLGFVVALQLGPMSLFLIRSTLRRGWLVGIAIGVGIAVVDGLYAAAGAAGAAPILAIDPIQVVLGLLGAAVLVALGVRTLWSAFRIRLGGEDESEVAGPRRAFVTAVAATASNPLTIASWAAIFSAASAAGQAGSATSAVLLILGVAIGSATWDTGLASGTALVGRAAGRKVLATVDVLAGAGMIAFGGALAYRSLHES
jgi:putative LysE/RhtB family amino acid efflux pump